MLKRQHDEYVFRTRKMNLKGKEQAWRFALKNKSSKVREKSRTLLISLLMNQEQEKFKERGKNNLGFLSEWLGFPEKINMNDTDEVINLIELLYEF